MISDYIVPAFIIAIILYSIFKKNNTYNSFITGAKSSFDLIITTIPYLVAIFILIEVFTISGLSNNISNALSPILNVFGIPKELSELIILKPFSGSGSLAVLENIFNTYGVDSYISKCACAVVSSGETIFFVSAVYFSQTKIKNLKYGIPVALIANFLGAVVGCFFCRFI